MKPVPVILFAYARPEHTRRTLEGLRANRIPLLYAYLDGPRGLPAVEAVASLLEGIDWCEVRLCRREENLGLGRSILTGVTEVFREHEEVIVFEDDLICVPGTYDYFCAALKRYRDDPRVMSVTAQTHPRITPAGAGDRPYFDGRAECWTWASWRRVWTGMEQDAVTLLEQCRRMGISPTAYGWDLPLMAEEERKRNLWAVRFCYLHLLRQGLCLRPPRSLVNNIGFGAGATNCDVDDIWSVPLPERAPAVWDWPEPRVDPDCAGLWRRLHPNPRSWWQSPRRAAGRLARKGRNLVLGGLRKGFGIDLRPKPDA